MRHFWWFSNNVKVWIICEDPISWTHYNFFTSFKTPFNRCGHVMSCSIQWSATYLSRCAARVPSPRRPSLRAMYWKVAWQLAIVSISWLFACCWKKTRVKDGWAVIMHFKRPRAILASPEAKDATLIAWLPSITKLFLELLWFVDTQTMLENAKCPNHWSRHWRDKRPFHTHLWTCISLHKGLPLICWRIREMTAPRKLWFANFLC